jgi:uncharacterized protein
MAHGFGIRLLHKWQEILSLHRWVAYVFPFAVFMILTSLEPSDPESTFYSYYPWFYTIKILGTLIALRLVWPVLKSLVRPVGWQGVAFGVVGAVVWIGVCNLQLEQTYFFPLVKRLYLHGLLGTGARSAFNPFVVLAGNSVAIFAYLFVRGFGLAVVVPIIEEYFLRAFLMRYIAAEKWWKFPIGKVTQQSAIMGTLIPMLMHPAELLAALLWFSMITWLYVRTKNLWECIAAHCTTNFLLGVYVLATGAWHFV